MSVNIQLEWTPNPATLKYVVDRKLSPSGALNFTSPDQATGRSPLASKLMSVKGVVGVMLGTNFVTVTKGGEGEWDEINDGVMDTLDTHLSSDQPVLSAGAEVPVAPVLAADGSVQSRIQKILDEEIRPAVANDGGDITLERFEAGIVYLHMVGSCAGCPTGAPPPS